MRRPVWAMNTSSNLGRLYWTNSTVHPNRLATSRMVGNAFSGDSTRMSSPFDVALTALIAGWPLKADSRDEILSASLSVKETMSPPNPIFNSTGWSEALPHVGMVVVVMILFDALCLYGGAKAFRRAMG